MVPKPYQTPTVDQALRVLMQPDMCNAFVRFALKLM